MCRDISCIIFKSTEKEKLKNHKQHINTDEQFINWSSINDDFVKYEEDEKIDIITSLVDNSKLLDRTNEILDNNQKNDNDED